MVTPRVARVRFSVFDTSGDTCCGTFQLTPPPTKKPPRPWMVTPAVARVRFSVAEETGGKPQLTQSGTAPWNVTVSLFGTKPFSSPKTRTTLRDGKATPVPQRNAPR